MNGFQEIDCRNEVQSGLRDARLMMSFIDVPVHVSAQEAHAATRASRSELANALALAEVAKNIGVAAGLRDARIMMSFIDWRVHVRAQEAHAATRASRSELANALAEVAANMVITTKQRQKHGLERMLGVLQQLREAAHLHDALR